MTSKVSVVIPSYNHEKYIVETIQSVIHQSYINLEIIIVDDGSTDKSCQLIRSVSDDRIIFIKQENQGAHAAINRGLEIASGDYISILNSDDLFTISRIEDCLSNIKKLGNQYFICSYIEVIDSKNKILGTKRAFKNMLPYDIPNPDDTFIVSSDPEKNLLMFNYIATTSNFFLHKSLIDNIGYFNKLRYVHDWDFLLRLIQDYPIHIIEKPLLKYRVHSRNTIKENQAQMILEICWILAKNYPRILPKLISGTESTTERFELYHKIYNSIQVYGCEKILLALILIFGNCQNNCNISDIENLLNPKHPLNQQFINQIKHILSKSNLNKNNNILKRLKSIILNKFN